MLKGILIGAGSVVLAGLAAALLVVKLGWVPANADARPPWLENWAARTALHAAIDRQMPKGENPAAATDANLLAGIRLYSIHCAVCHGAADGKPSTIARGLYQHAPQLGRHGVEDDPYGETWWKIDHGIRMTGMPAFGPSLTQEQIDQLTLFLQHMDSLAPGPRKAWEALPSQAR